VIQLLHEIIVEDQDEEFINEIISSKIKDNELNFVNILHFKSYVNGQTALETARCESRKAPEDERLMLMVEILKRLEEKLVQSEAAVASPVEDTDDYQHNDNQMVQELNGKISDYDKIINESEQALSGIETGIKNMNGLILWAAISGNKEDMINATRIANEVVETIKDTKEKAKRDKEETKTELEELRKSLDNADLYNRTGKFGGKKSKKRKSTRKMKVKSRKTNKRRSKK
jgi:hypothetical protein